eukprot:scaffold272637_cov15-Tisochrysis_lutea.AAC.1
MRLIARINQEHFVRTIWQITCEVTSSKCLLVTSAQPCMSLQETREVIGSFCQQGLQSASNDSVVHCEPFVQGPQQACHNIKDCPSLAPRQHLRCLQAVPLEIAFLFFVRGTLSMRKLLSNPSSAL